MRLIVLSSALLLAACVATNPATGSKHFSLVSETQEYQLGDQHIGQAIKDSGGLYKEDPALASYLDDLMKQTVAVSERADKPFEFYLADSADFNAFALPGHITFLRGILPYFNSEAELMFVMGHEIGHVTARHTARQQTGAVFANIGLMAAQIAVAQQTNSQAAVDTTAQLGGLTASAGLATYGRAHEREADRLGLRYISRLGYDVTAGSNVSATMAAYREYMKKRYELAGEPIQESLLGHIMSSHPSSEERKELLEALEAEQVALNPNGRVGRVDYLEKINNIAFGPSPEAGVYAHGRYYNSKYRMAYRTGDGWFFPQVKGASQMPEAVHKESKSRLYIIPEKIDKDVDAEEHMLYNYSMTTDREGLRGEGYEIHTGRVDGWRETAFSARGYGRIAVVRNTVPMSDDTKGKGLIFVFTAPDKETADKMDETYMNILRSYQALTKAQADQLQPLRIKLQPVKAGDTVASLARQMPQSVLFEEHFRILNGLTGDRTLKTGNLVKMVHDPNKDLSFIK